MLLKASELIPDPYSPFSALLVAGLTCSERLFAAVKGGGRGIGYLERECRYPFCRGRAGQVADATKRNAGWERTGGNGPGVGRDSAAGLESRSIWRPDLASRE